MTQINLFEEIEKADRDERARKQIQHDYMEWLKAPDLTPCDSSTRHFNYNIYCHIYHICDQMPDDDYMWMNTLAWNDGGEYWLLNQKGECAGELMEKCPYCGADLQHGEGQRYLKKADGHWYSEESYRKYYKLDEVKP